MCFFQFRSQPLTNLDVICNFSALENISPEEEYKIALPPNGVCGRFCSTLASNVMSQYSPAIEGKIVV